MSRIIHRFNLEERDEQIKNTFGSKSRHFLFILLIFEQLQYFTDDIFPIKDFNI